MAKIDGAVSELFSLQAQIVSQLGDEDEMGLAGRSPVAAELPWRSAPRAAANAEGAPAEASEGIFATPTPIGGGRVAAGYRQRHGGAGRCHRRLDDRHRRRRARAHPAVGPRARRKR